MEKTTEQIRFGRKDLQLSVARRIVSGDVLVLMHGLGGSQEVFRDIWAHPAFDGISLVSFDFPGYGGSEKPEDFSYAMEDLAKGVSLLLRALAGRHHLHIAAHSMGGAVALLLDEDILDRVSTFASLEGNLIGEDCFLSRKAISGTDDYFFLTFFPKLTKNMAGTGLMFEDLMRCSPTAFYRCCQSLVNWSDSGELLDRFKQLTCNKAYFLGDRNAEIEAVRQLSDIRKIKIKDSGHMMMLDNPEDFFPRLKSFFR